MVAVVSDADQRTQDVIKAVRDLYLHMPKSMFAQPRFRELWRTLSCLDGPLFPNEPNFCEKQEAVTK